VAVLQIDDSQLQVSGEEALSTDLNRAVALHRQGKLAEAERIYCDVLRQQANHFEALHLLGVIALQTSHAERAVELIGKAIALKPDCPEAHYNRGLALHHLKRFRDALASYDRAIALKSDYLEAHHNRGRVLQRLNRPGPALASFERAIALKPDFALAHYYRGNALNALKRQEEALASYDKAIELKPDLARAYNDRGSTLNALRRFDESVASYEKAVSLKPEIELLLSNFLAAKMAICDWRNFAGVVAQIVENLELAARIATPHLVLTISDSPELQHKAAKVWTLTRHHFNNAAPIIAKRPTRQKIRLGYFCSDFHDHATTRLIAELFEKHDRTRFELHAFSFGPNIDDEMRQRVSAAFDEFIDVRNQSDADVAMLTRRREIDIAVNLNGLQQNSRTGIFAYRAAPLQVSYLAYPGTMGANYIDYLIADRTVIPASSQEYFSEKIAYLPNSYQANDRKRRIADKAFSRAEVGLPDAGFVFCCFNNNFKITPDVFDIWMRILKRVDGSVLWLLEANPSAAANLRKEASARGIGSERLVFAKLTALPNHLARHRLADLFLDTLPYNAHTSASDALWTGLPVLTRIGETFAARVAAGLLTAIGLPELITSTPQAYEELAIELATNSNKLATIKHKLANNRLATPLFDSELFTKQIEAAYTAMYERYHSGLPPDHIYVPN
jgi:predicted O-linked N-acetylglucosamine transferase (SPINDLY family)